MELNWRAAGPGLLYEAQGDSERLYIVAFDGERWTLDLFQDTEYEREQLVDPQPALTLDDAKQRAQEWEIGLR